jgi:hypothetical protein
MMRQEAGGPRLLLHYPEAHCQSDFPKMMPANDQTNENDEYYDDYDDDGKNHLLMFVSFWLQHEHLQY